MIRENEIVMLVLGIGVLILILANRLRLKRLPSSGILIAGFFILLLAWFLTVLEGLLWGEVLNYLEHMCYAASGVLVGFWSWKVFVRGRGVW